MRGNARLASALQTVTAAVVGVIANLAVTFAIVTLFREVRIGLVPRRGVPGPGVDRRSIPSRWRSPAFAFVGLWLFRWHVVPVIVGSAAAGLVVKGLL